MSARIATARATHCGASGHGDDIGYLLKQLSSVFRRRLDERLRNQDLGLSMAHMAALFTLQDEPGLAGAQLARRTMISAQAMNGVLRRLEREGSIDRRPQAENRRTDSWNLTPAGARQLGQARKVAEPVMQEMLSGLSAAEREVLKRLLTRCIAALDAAPPPAMTRRGA